MTKYRKKPVVIEATQWFKNGDHPEAFWMMLALVVPVAAWGLSGYGC